jgi:signal transduction histidine kinase
LAHKELLLHHDELEKYNSELIISNQNLQKKQQINQILSVLLQEASNILTSKITLNDKSSIQLKSDINALKKEVVIYNDSKQDLEKIMYTLSHKIRKEVANILGISNLLIEHEELTPTEFGEMMNIIIHSAQSLNIFTEEISNSIHKKR